MSHLAERIISDLRTGGLALEDLGDAWFALPGAHSPEALLYLTDGDVTQYVAAMSAEDVSGVFGDDVTLDESRYRLTLVHLEECLLSAHRGIRHVIVDGEQIRVFDTEPPLTAPPGDYEWRSEPRGSR